MWPRTLILCSFYWPWSSNKGNFWVVLSEFYPRQFYKLIISGGVPKWWRGRTRNAIGRQRRVGSTPTSSAMELLISKISSSYLFKRQRFFNDFCGFFLGLIFQMTISIDRCADVAVAYPIPDTLHRHFIGHHQAYAGMTEVMKSNMGQSGFLEQICMSVGDVIRINDFTQGINANISQPFVAVGVAAKLPQLPVSNRILSLG